MVQSVVPSPAAPAAHAPDHPFLIAAPFVMLALVCVLFVREVALRTSVQRAVDGVPDYERVAVGVAR